jgi:hypothetical protein
VSQTALRAPQDDFVLCGQLSKAAAVLQVLGHQHNRELFGGTPTLRLFLGCRHDFPLQPPGLPQFVEGDHVDAQLSNDNLVEWSRQSG